MIYEFLNARPDFDDTCFVAPSADIIGDVRMGSETSVWFNTTLRGDVNYIEIGERSNIQDNSCIHVTNKTGPTIIGDQVTIGHSCVIHGCTIHNRVLVGINSVILDNAVIKSDCFIGAGSLVPPGKTLDSGYLYMGSPAKPIRKLTDEELAFLVTSSDNYVKYMRAYQQKDIYEINPFYNRK